MRPLPRLMVAPNGARLTQSDHPGIPVTIPEIVACALDCMAAGADGLHAHVRDADQRHVLDAGQYAELLVELGQKAPDLYVQITTEAVGRYTPAEQRSLVETLRPYAVSIALREITAGEDDATVRRFFHFCAEAGVGVQHILYDTDDIAHLARLLASGTVPREDLKALIVLGRYAEGLSSSPADLDAPAAALEAIGPPIDWAVCAFGAGENACLHAAEKRGAKVRIGFENNRTNADGTLAATNAERIRDYLSCSERAGP
ncbi:3-keto-5-aminohexanoate cleavage protein [Ostreiculturibacter nitratireducens]|uniref:3-keto-5-aminohexanoate cleavage protein n=1 Tax=Ostreiculturibacter nitratireducens TaxID=3075226 RepID=UPI0031B60B02